MDAAPGVSTAAGEDLFDSTRDFDVRLDVFSGPFSVLLSMIARKQLDVTEVALAAVTDEFIGFVRAQPAADLSQMSEFLLVAATLLDLKAARLLPGSDPDDEDTELLEERDLLFAKLLQYKAFKEVAEDFEAKLRENSRAAARDVPLEERFTRALPPLELNLTLTDLALLAVQAFSRDTSEPTVEIGHLHVADVPVAPQMELLAARLREGARSFTDLCADAPDTATVVARFLAVLTLLRRKAVSVQQDAPLTEIVVVGTPDDDTGEPLGGEDLI